jgi:hypothetical protein
MIGHAAPEAAVVVVDVSKRRIDVDEGVGSRGAAAGLGRRRSPRYRGGVFAKCAAQVAPASDGAVTQP